MRSIDSNEAKTLPSAGDIANPFFSPDGEWLGFYSYDSRKLEKLAIAGGSPQPLCEVTGITTASWPETGSIFLALGGQGLFRVPEGPALDEFLMANQASAVEERDVPDAS